MERSTSHLYQILGVPKSSTQDEIKKAYRRLALRYHPDKVNVAEVPDHATRFRDIAAAYEVLGDPKKRQFYDKYGMMGVKMAGTEIGEKLVEIESLLCSVFLFLSTLIILLIIFLSFLSLRVDGKVNWNYYIVFIPLWIFDAVLVFSIIQIISRPVEEEEDAREDDEETEGENRSTESDRERRKQQKLKGRKFLKFVRTSIALITIFFSTVFKVLIVMKANDYYSLTAPQVFIPFFIVEGAAFVLTLMRLLLVFIAPGVADVPFLVKLILVFEVLWWRSVRIALAVLIMLRVDERITCSWGVVFIPLYLVGLKYLLQLISDYRKFSRMQNLEMRQQGQSMIIAAGVGFVIVGSLFYSLVGLLAAKLDGHVFSASRVLIPIFIVLSIMLCCTGCCMPCLLLASGNVEHDMEEGPQVRLVSPNLRIEEGEAAASIASASNDFYVVPHIVRSGETIPSSSYTVSAGGKGANQSVALGRAGANVYHAGKIGKDGEWVRSIMEKAGVDTSYIKVSEKEATGRAIIQLSKESHDNAIVLFPGTNSKVTLEEAQHVLKDFGPGDWLVMQNEISSGGKIMQAAKEKGLTICFNPSPMTAELPEEYPLHLVDYLIINEIEAQELYAYLTSAENYTESKSVPKSSSHVTASESFPVLEKAYGEISGIIITLGGDGLVARFRIKEEDEKLKEFRMGIVKNEIVNTTGAGDTFTGYFVANLVRNQVMYSRFTEEQLKDALHEASHAASLAVTKEGAMDSIPIKDDVDVAIKEKPHYKVE
ncbi:hypothetical protein BGZ46_006100 [Entomortierella lignicola]|nr:hypothetical protein BGZ46_006100 [Entomortierella lignicola]